MNIEIHKFISPGKTNELNYFIIKKLGQKWTGPMQYEDKTGELMMLPSDLALVNDPNFKPIVELYAKNNDLFFSDFAYAFSKLLELGVDF